MINVVMSARPARTENAVGAGQDWSGRVGGLIYYV
jgi:hypothetical protein